MSLQIFPSERLVYGVTGEPAYISDLENAYFNIKNTLLAILGNLPLNVNTNTNKIYRFLIIIN